MAFLFSNQHDNKGFTLIEILIAMAIIGILMATIAFSITEMIRRGKVARAQGDLSTIGKAIRQLELDTDRDPGGELASSCISSGVYFGFSSSTASEVGLLSGNLSTFPNWKGPYIEEIPTDPWGKEYYIRYDYPCKPTTKGCEKYSTDTTVRAIFSSGPDKSAVSSNAAADLADDVVIPLCE